MTAHIAGRDSTGVFGPFLRERVTSGFPVITTDHALIHEGIAFTQAGVLTVANGKDASVRVTAPGRTGVKASTVVDMTNANADLTYEAVEAGPEGNDLTVTHVDPGVSGSPIAVSVSGEAITVSLETAPDVPATLDAAGMLFTAVPVGVLGNAVSVVLAAAVPNQAFSVAVVGQKVTVNLATNASTVITSTKEDVAVGIAATPAAAALVVASDGTGLLMALAETSLAGGSDGGAIVSTANDVKAAVEVDLVSMGMVSVTVEGTGLGVVNAKAVQSLSGGTSPVYVHLKPIGVQATGQAIVTLYEEATVTGTETAVEPRNRNRFVAGVEGDDSSVQVRTCVDATFGATTIDLDSVIVPGGGQGATRIGGAVDQAEEWVLDPGKDYVMKLDNTAGAENKIAYSLLWYEEESA